MSNELMGKKVLILQQRYWAVTVGSFLARKLRDEGCKLAALTLKRTTHEYILNQKEINYEFVISIDDLKNDPKGYLKGDSYSLEDICSELGIDSIWNLVQSSRVHVKSYKDKFYYSNRQNVSDEGIVDYIQAVYKCAKTVFEDFKPDFIISPNFATLHHIIFNLYAEKKGIKMLGIADTKVKDYYFINRSYFEDKGSLLDRADALNRGEAITENRENSKKYIEEFRKNFKNPEDVKLLAKSKANSLGNFINRWVGALKLIARWYIKGPTKDYNTTIGVTIDYRPPRIILRDCRKQNQYKKAVENFHYYPFEKLKKYVYLPLQIQPESTIDVLAPFFSNQIEIARQIAMSLPGDYTLAVKDHPGMLGFRSLSFLEKLSRTPNVKLIDYRISNENLIKGADLIISPNSTTIAEAAFYWKPAIQLGNLGTTLRFPNIFRHTDLTTLSLKIDELLALDLKSEKYERHLQNYIAAVYDVGFKFKYHTFWLKGKGDNPEILWQAYKKEILK